MKYVVSSLLLLVVACSQKPVQQAPVTKMESPVIAPAQPAPTENKVVLYTKIKINNTRALVLEGEVREYNMVALSGKLKEYAVASTDPVWLIINSPGGSVMDGYDFINTMESVREHYKVKTKCVVKQEAASMAAIIAIFCDELYMHKRAYLMFHEASYGVRGSQRIVRTRAEFFDKFLDNLNKEIAAKLNMTEDEYTKRISVEWWITASEAAHLGLLKGVTQYVHYTAQPPKQPELPFFLFGTRTGQGVQNPLRGE